MAGGSETHGRTPPHRVGRRAGHTDPSWHGERLQSSDAIDAVAVDLPAVGDHLTQMDANAESYVMIPWNLLLLDLELTLNLHGAGKGIDDAGEFGEEGVSGEVPNASAPAIYKGGEGIEPSAELAMSPELIAAGQTTVAGNVSAEDRGEPPSERFLSHPSVNLDNMF